MILVAVQQTADVQLARALLHALGSRYDWFLLFAKPEFKRLWGEVSCKYSFDPAFCILNPQNFDLVISFSGIRHPGMRANLQLLAFFNEICVPTLEIQHGLFQYGINSTDVGLQVGSNVERGDQIAFGVGYGAARVVRWGGDDGIGYLKSNLPPRTKDWRQGFGLITTNSNWHVYTGKHRNQLAIAILKLAARYPEQHFIWKPHHAEYGHVDAKQAITMVERYELANLTIERHAPAEDLIPNCRFGISTVSTTLLDYQLSEKPVLVYACEPVMHLLASVRAKRFSTATSLQEALPTLLASPDEYRVDTGVGALDEARLVDHIEQALGHERVERPGHDLLPIMLKHLDARRALVERPELERVGQQVEHMQQQLGQQVEHMHQHLSQRVDHVSRKFGDYQRSTLAYKTKKLLKAES